MESTTATNTAFISKGSLALGASFSQTLLDGREQLRRLKGRQKTQRKWVWTIVKGISKFSFVSEYSLSDILYFMGVNFILCLCLSTIYFIFLLIGKTVWLDHIF